MCIKLVEHNTNMSREVDIKNVYIKSNISIKMCEEGGED